MTKSTDPELNDALEADAAKIAAMGGDAGPALEDLDWFEIARERGSRGEKLAEGVPRIKAVKLAEPYPEGMVHPVIFGKIYLVIGEVASCNHFILLDIHTGKILPGMFHLSDFVEATDEDL